MCAFFVLAVLNNFKLTEFSPRAIFGLSFGALLMCISSNLEGKMGITIKGRYINILAVIKNSVNILSASIIVLSIFLKETEIMNQLILTFDNNTILLLSLGFTIMSIITNDINNKRYDTDTKEEVANKVKEVLDTITKHINKQNK